MSRTRRQLLALGTIAATLPLLAAPAGADPSPAAPVAGTDGSSLVMSGRGRGHGVGGSLDGYQNRAAAGQTAGAILGTYFPGTHAGSLGGSPPIAVGVEAQPEGMPVRLAGGRGG